jgi:hypothetical protein
MSNNALIFRIVIGLLFIAQYLYGGRFGEGNVLLLVMGGAFMIFGLVGFTQLQQRKIRQLLNENYD